MCQETRRSKPENYVMKEGISAQEKADLEDPAQGHSCHYKARLICILPLTSCLPWRTFLALCAQVTLELAFGALPAVMPLIKPGAPSEQNSHIQEAAREDTASSRY